MHALVRRAIQGAAVLNAGVTLAELVPANALRLGHAMVRLFLIVTRMSKASCLALMSLSTAMILAPSLFGAVCGPVPARRGEGAAGAAWPADTPVAAPASVGCGGLLYAAGLKCSQLSALPCAPGAAPYRPAKRQRAERAFAGREWLIDDVLRVSKARNDHDAFTSAMIEPGLRVLEMHDRLAQSVSQPAARAGLLDRTPGPDFIDPEAAQSLRPWLAAPPPARLAAQPIGALAQAELPFEPTGLLARCVGPFGNLSIEMASAEGWGDPDRDQGLASLEVGDVMPPGGVGGGGAVRVGMGERRLPQAVSSRARTLFERGAATQVLAAQIATRRRAIHLDTVFTLCDRDLVTVLPELVDAIRVHRIRPGSRAGSLDVRTEARLFLGGVADAIGLPRLRSVATGGDAEEPECERWDEGQHLLALAPGVVTACDRNTHTHTLLRKAGLEVIAAARRRVGAQARRRPLHVVPDRARRALNEGIIMSFDLRNRGLLDLKDFPPRAIRRLPDPAAELTRAKAGGTEPPRLKGKNIAPIFEAASTHTHTHTRTRTRTRTRCAFAMAVHDQGVHVVCFDSVGSQRGHQEPLKDTARVLVRLYDGIRHRGFHQSVLEDLARFSHAPAWNRLTGEVHPTQVLADLLTKEKFGAKPLHELSFGDFGGARFNLGCSLRVGGTQRGMDVRIAAPAELQPPAGRVAPLRELAQRSGARITIEADPLKWAAGADLPCTDAVFESDASIVFTQAENRMHAIKAVRVATLA